MSRKALFAALEKSAPHVLADLAKVAVAADLAILVEKAGIKRSELAERLGWTRARVSQVLSGEGNLTIETIHAVARAVGCSFDVVFREASAIRATQRWEDRLPHVSKVGSVLSLTVPQRQAHINFRRPGGAVEVIVTNEQSFEATNDASNEWISAA